MAAQQGGLCAICKERPSGFLHVDHDHLTGKVRELLCLECNTLLGKAKESVERLNEAVAYLQKHKEKTDA